MTRIQQSKLLIGVIGIGAVVFIAANFYFLGPVKGLGAVLAVQLFIIINNRKQKETLKSFNIARKLHKTGRYEEAITMFLTYLKEIKDNPEKQKTSMLNFGLYTTSTIAMSFNNIGAACIELGHYDKAEESLERAIEEDGDYAIPYYNMSLIATLKGDDELVNRYLSKMNALGYKVSMDQITAKVNQLPKEGGDQWPEK
jgi:tetratricopeptide (TPR) repeat protein